MRKNQPALFLVCFVLIGVAQCYAQKKFDVVLLSSGGKAIGTIVQRAPDQPLQIMLTSGQSIFVEWADIKQLDTLWVADTTLSMASMKAPKLPPDSTWQIRSRDSLFFASNVRLDSLAGDTLFVSDAYGSYSIPIDTIYEIRLVRMRSSGTGALVGTGIGAVIGFLFPYVFMPEAVENPGWLAPAPHAVFVPLGALVGTGIGAILGAHLPPDLVITRDGKDIQVFKQQIEDLCSPKIITP